MIQVLAIIPSPTDATAFYRAISPFSQLRKTEDLNLFFFPSVDWTAIKLHDVVFMQRPYRQEDLRIAQITKDVHRPLWIDYDDDLFSVPMENDSWALYNHPEIQKNMQKLVMMADVITVSTDALKARLSPLNNNIVVVPNAWDDDLMTGDLGERRRKLIMWRGSRTHVKDLQMVPIVEFSKQHPDFSWEFVGYNPWFLTEKMSNVTHAPSKEIPQYLQYLREHPPGFFVCPLQDTVFNRAKSNIAWIEATMAGSPMLAPNFVEWQKPGIINYDGPDDFERKLKAMITGEINCEAAVKQSWGYVRSELDVTKVNEIRSDLLHSII